MSNIITKHSDAELLRFIESRCENIEASQLDATVFQHLDSFAFRRFGADRSAALRTAYEIFREELDSDRRLANDLNNSRVIVTYAWLNRRAETVFDVAELSEREKLEFRADLLLALSQARAVSGLESEGKPDQRKGTMKWAGLLDFV